MYARLRSLTVVLAAAVAVTACAPRTTPVQQPLVAVAPLPAPAVGVPIARVAPLGDVDTLAQVRILFTDNVIPLERLESPDEAAVLSHFTLAPALPGRFRFLTPRMIGFEADRAWPVSTRVRVTVAKGIRDVHGHELTADVSWTFQTPGIALTDLPSKDETDARELRPTLSFASNVVLDRASLIAHAHVRPAGGTGGDVAVIVPPDTPGASATPALEPAPEEQYDASQREHRYVVTPAHDLAKDERYDLVFDPGIATPEGNRPSETTFTGTFRTHGDLRLVGATQSSGGRFAGGDPQLTFSTPLDEKSLAGVTLSPAPSRGSTPFAVSGETLSVNASLLAPNASYTVTLPATLADAFGQRLGSEQHATFRTGDLSPDVWAPDGAKLFPSSRDVRLNIVAVNAPRDVRAVFRPLSPADVVRFDDPTGGATRNTSLPASDAWPHFDASGAKNVERTIEVPLRARLGAPGGVLAYGVTASLPQRDDPFVAAGVVQLTDLGAFAQWFPDGGNVRVNRIADGAPVAGARVDVYPSQTQATAKTTPVACATASTDAQGVAVFGGAAFARCARYDKGEETAPSFVTIVRSGTDWTYVRTEPYAGAYAGDFYNGWSSATPEQRGTIFSDRALYQPGETAQLTAVGWFLVDGTLRRGVAPSYALTLELPSGEKRDLGRRALNAFGTFSFPAVLRKDAPLGTYTVRASAGNGETIVGDFRVAEFKPPNFKVDLAVDHAVAVRGAAVAAGATNAYLFGAPLAGASTKFTVTRSPADFTPKGRDAYTFGRHWFWPQDEPDAATDVLETTQSVDANGKSAASFTVASDLPFPMDYRIDAETTDASNVSVAADTTITALPSDTLIGVKADDVGTAGTPLSVAVLATDPAGKPRAGTSVHVELQRADYASATQIVEGAEQPVESVTYATVASADATTADGPVLVKLTPAAAGEYRLRASLAGAKDDASETDAEVYVGGSGEGAWFARDPNVLTVKLDKTSYKPGDTATALVQSPFANAELHVAVVRHGVLWETTRTTAGSAPTVRFTVTPDMLPNAAVEAFIVRRGPPPAKDLADGGNALARVGFMPFDVALDAKYVTATVRAQSAMTTPGASQTVRVHIGAKGTPVRAQVTLMVVNDAVLQLTGYRPPDLVKTVYATQPISTRYADNRANLVLQTLHEPLEKGWGFGGGLSGEEADPRVRRAFKPLAYFAGALTTDAQGNASATFTLPDDLTIWRVLVVGASADGRFGNGETMFKTTVPLVANPVVPQFARPGDRFDAGVAVTNGTGATGDLHVDASLTGPLSFLQHDKPVATETLDTPLDRITKAYRFPVTATGAGESTATVRVRSGGASDAFAIPVPVRDLDVRESVAQTGTTDAHASVGIDVAADTPRDAGGVDVVLASSLLPEIAVAAGQALASDEPLTISAAGRLAVASDLAILVRRTGASTAAMRTRALTELATLRALRRDDGGFASYRLSDVSDPRDSLTAFAALARARTAGIAVDNGLYAGAHAYAATVLADPQKKDKYCKSDRCKAELRLQALDALDTAGDRRTTFLSDIAAQSDTLAFADQARLARLMTSASGYASQAASLAKTVEDKLYVTARGAAVDLPGRYRWFDDPVTAQAAALRLELARDADADTLDRIARALLDMRRNGSFGCACENAAALDALVDLASRERPANFTATASLGGRTVTQQRFSGARDPQRTAHVAMRDMPQGASTIALAKDGTGTLHYAVTYTYRLAGAAPGRLAGLRVTRVVRQANTTPVLATMGLAAPAGPLTVAAAHVYDVELQIVSDHPIERVFITDPLPAGMEAVDTTFATASHALTTPSSAWQIGDQQIRADRIEAYADRLDAGIYRLHYLARTVTPGTFLWPGAGAHLVDRPDELGRSATSQLVIQ